MEFSIGWVIQANLLNPDQCRPYISVGSRQNLDYAYRNYMYRKGPGPSNLSGKDQNLDYTGRIKQVQ